MVLLKFSYLINPSLSRCLLLLFLLCAQLLLSQNVLIDSLILALDKQEVVSQQLDLLNQITTEAITQKKYPLAKTYARRYIQLATQQNNKTAALAGQKELIRAYYYERNRDSSLLYLADFIPLAEALNDPTNLGWGYNFYGLIYKNRSAYEKAIGYFEKSQKVRAAIGDSTGVASCYNNLGLVHQNIGNYEKAIESYLRSLTIREARNDETRIANLHLNLGNLYTDIGDYPKGLAYYLKVLAYYESVDNQSRLAGIYNNLGNNQKDQGNTKEALAYYEKSLAIAKALPDQPMVSIVLGNLGNIYGRLGNHQKNKAYLLESLAIEKELGDLDGIARTYLNLGMTSMALEANQEALNFLLESNKIYTTQNATIHIANSNIEIGRVYLKLGQYQKALQKLETGLTTAKEKGNWIMQAAAYQTLAQTYQAVNNYPKALANFEYYSTAKDTLLNAAKTKQVAQMSAQYEYEKNQNAIQKLRAEKATQQLAAREQLWHRNLMLGLALGGLILLAALYLLYRYRQKKKEAIHEKQRVKELLRIDQLKDQFLANTSHELRTPLNGIIGLASSLEAGVAGNLPTKAKENLQLISKSGQRLSNLINDILDFSKLKNADLNLDLKPVDLSAATNIIFALSRPLILNRPLELINELPATIPLVEADENRIQQVLHNLIGNAIKFTEKGSVRVSGQQNGDFFELSIKDTGIGIPTEKQQVIFNSFEQLDGSTTRTYSGTGLGLSISKQLIELHQGKIWLNSVWQQGSVFSFSLPISKTQNVNDSVPKVIPIAPQEKLTTFQLEKGAALLPTSKKTRAVNTEGIRILIVDDEPINRQVLENHLELEGYASISAADGLEALKLIDDGERFDLIILDIMMPRLSGYAVCDKLREQFSPVDLPIVLLTAKTGLNDLMQGFESGANDFVTKPFSKDELISRIKTHLNLYHLNKASRRFVPHEFLKAIGGTSISDLKLGDSVFKNVTVMFTDIRDYTALSEQMTPEQNFKFVNAFLSRLAPYIRNNKGFINQFLGDGFMAIFPESENYALKAAIEIQHKLKEYNNQRLTIHRQPIHIGIGMNAGPLIMGIIGDDSRTDPAIISDTVNTASRMEGLTKHYGVNIIVSESFVNRLENSSNYHFRFLGKVKVKGKEKSTGIYESFEGDNPETQSLKLMTLEVFEKGIHAFIAGDFQKASTHFLEVLSVNEADKPALYFFKRCTDFTSNGSPEHWDGIDLLYSK